MEKAVQVGDVVLSTSGRDKNKIFLVVSIENRVARIVDGKTHKILAPKKKNVKHLIKVSSEGQKDLAEKIQLGKVVGNENIYRVLKAEKEKKQED